MSTERFGIIQMTSGADPQSNLDYIAMQLKTLSSQGVSWVLLPENAIVFGNKQDYHSQAEPLDNGDKQRFLAALCVKHNLNLIVGSFPILHSSQQVTTTTLVYDCHGQLLNHYDKLHMFDVDVADGFKRYRESETFLAGEHIAVVPTDFGAIGLSICYDLRFPQLYAALRSQGANVIVVPAAFTAVTGKAHWEVLLRARAIETQCWIIAANQGGTHPCGRETWGHSMVVSPWGEIQAELEQAPGLLIADVNTEIVDEVRQAMPVAHHIRFEQNLSFK